MRLLKADPADRLSALRINPYFEHLDEGQLTGVASCVSLRAYERGETLFFEGDACAGLQILDRGCVKLYRLSPQGRQYIVRLVQEQDTFNEVSTFDGESNPVNAEAIEPSRVWVVEPDCVRELVRNSPPFAQKVIYHLGRNLRTLVRAVSEMAFYQVTHRLARLIASLPEGDLDGSSRGRWTQEQLAARLGTVREVVARSLRELERSGAIRSKNRRIAIADPGVLEQWIQGPWN